MDGVDPLTNTRVVVLDELISELELTELEFVLDELRLELLPGPSIIKEIVPMGFPTFVKRNPDSELSYHSGLIKLSRVTLLKKSEGEYPGEGILVESK